MYQSFQQSSVYTNINGHEKELATRVVTDQNGTSQAFRARNKRPDRPEDVLLGRRSSRDRQWTVRHNDLQPTRQPEDRYRRWFSAAPSNQTTIVVPARPSDPFDHPFFRETSS